MKSYCRGYEIGSDQVREAYADWAAHQSGRRNRWRVEAKSGGADALVDEIAREVRARTLSFTPMRRLARVEPGSGKRRELTVESCKQQVCDYVVARALGPMIDARIGFWQYGGRHVRSALDLARAVKRWEHDSAYWVHLDVRRCYQSIECDLVHRMLARYVRSPDVLYVADRLLASHGGSLALGSYLSLRLCQWLLSFGYHHVEGLHKSRRGRQVQLVTHQGWYMDDIWLLGTRKRDVQAAARRLERYLGEAFGLSLHPWQVCRVGDDEPIDVAGYMVRPGRITIRDSTFLRADRARRRFRRRPTVRGARTVVSHKGRWTQTDCRGYLASHDVDADLRRARKLISATERRRKR